MEPQPASPRLVVPHTRRPSTPSRRACSARGSTRRPRRPSAVDLDRLADELLVEVHRQLALQALLEQALEVEGAVGAAPGDVGEVAFDLLYDLLALRFEFEAEFLVERLRELLGVHLVVLVFAALLAGFAVLITVVAGLGLWLADWVTLVGAFALADAALVALVVLELREVDEHIGFRLREPAAVPMDWRAAIPPTSRYRTKSLG